MKEKDIKMATFYNQASITFGNTVINSNVASGELVTALTLTKTAVSENYATGDGITYVITITNNGTTDSAGLTLTDNLGAYTLPECGAAVTPLTYVEGSLLYYQNGVLTAAPTVTANGTLTVEGITVPAGGNATLIYETRANSTAPLESGGVITNTATLPTCENLTATATVPVRDEANPTISKAVCPGEVTCSGEITYTFTVQNPGNIPIVATDNLVVNDIFDPALSGITVSLDGETLAEGTGYTYDEESGVFSTLPGAIPVPAATFTRDCANGNVVTTPGFTTLTVTGII